MAKKISILQFDIKQLTNLREGTNKIVTENEIRGFVPYENLLDVVDELEKRWTDAYHGIPSQSFLIQIPYGPIVRRCA